MESRELMGVVSNRDLIVEALLGALEHQRSLLGSNQISFAEWKDETQDIINTSSIFGVSEELLSRIGTESEQS